jgi:hypothetical protein
LSEVYQQTLAFRPDLDQITALYAEAFRWYHPRTAVPPIHVSFYPYIGINHTIRLRDGDVYVRIGDLCDEMPLACHKGLAFILVGKLLRKKIPDGARDVYSAYIDSEFIREKARENKRDKGRKVVTTAKGEAYDLDEIFDQVNRHYFAGWIKKPVLTWSAKKTYRILGHHDETHGHIAISKSLDSVKVPRYIVEYVLFHEMLHIAHPTRHINGRRHNHTAEFKRDEQRFAHYERAEQWIEQNVGKMKRAARKR